MRSGDKGFFFDANFDFGSDNLLVAKNSDYVSTFPPVSGVFKLLDGTDFLKLDGTNFNLL